MALPAGAQADAPDAVAASVTSEAAITAASLRAFKVCLPQIDSVNPRLAPCRPRSGRVIPGRAAGYASDPSAGRGRQLVALGLDVVEQLLEGVRELLDEISHGLKSPRKVEKAIPKPRIRVWRWHF